ncbi:MAG: L-threonylcarbamoyladenylate synthase [Candidatus Izemoplasmatales bacterium]
MIVSLSELLTKDLWGKVIVFPTDTVYGIGCLLSDLESVKRIYEIKERDYSKPFAILISSTDQLNSLVKDTASLEPYASRYWPGALTLISAKNDLVDPLITAGNPTVGIRMPRHEISLAILNHFGPMVVTSLNISSKPSILDFEEAKLFEDQVDYMIDGGTLSHSASTVFDTITKKVLRQGELVIKNEE